MSYLDKLLVDGDTLLIDNSSLEIFMKCPKRFYYARVLRRRPVEEKAALTFGSAIHLALKLRYHRGAGQVTDDTEKRQMYILEEFWSKRPTPMGDHRTLQLAQQVICKYNMEYRDEPFGIVTNEGGRVVEQPFSAFLGIVDGIKVVWTGRIDLIVAYPSGPLYVFDHKTSSMSGEYISQDYYLSSQFKGYTWALKSIRPGVPVGGTIANLLIARKPTKTGKGTEFLRVRLDYDDEMLLEWQHSTLAIVSDLINCAKRGDFPLHTTQCMGRYGKCEYMDVDLLSPVARELYIRSNVYEDDDWTPLRDDEVSVQKVLDLPASVIAERVGSLRPPTDGPMLTSIDDLIQTIV